VGRGSDFANLASDRDSDRHQDQQHEQLLHGSLPVDGRSPDAIGT
jgi:hypothetical protein